MMAKPRQKKMAALAAALFWVAFLLWPWAVPARAETDYSSAAGVFRFIQGENDALAPAVICTADNEIWCFTIPMSESDAQQMDAVAGALVVWQKWHLAAYAGNLGSVSLWTMEEYEGESQAPRTLVRPQQGTVCTLVYALSESDYATVQGVTLGELVDADNRLIALEGVGSQEINYPAALVDGSGNIVAVAVSSDTAFAVIDASTYGGAGGSGGTGGSGGAGGSGGSGGSGDTGDSGDNPLLFGAAVGGATAVVYGLFKRKKNRSAPAAQNNEIPPASPAYDPALDSAESVTRMDPLPPIDPVAPQPNRPQLCLVATGGYMMGRIYPMENAELTIGRSPTAAVPYKVESVSKLHCKLYRDQAGRWMLMDCNSRNGTYLKRLGKLSPMQPVEVFPGDTFFLGSPQYSFEIRS